MKEKKWIGFFLSISVMCIFICLVVFYFSPINYWRPLKPNCLPIKYPQGALMGAEDGKVTTYEVTVSTNELKLYFEQNLRDPKNRSRIWVWSNAQNGDVLFECASAANALEAERGCIYLKNQGKTTSITSVWSHYPDSAPQCSYFITELLNK